jgi:hypothetical protein
MTQRRATPICERCLLNPTGDVYDRLCEACADDEQRAVSYRIGGPIGDYLRTWDPEGVTI